LAENAGLSPIGTVTELRAQHANGNKDFGVNVRKVRWFLLALKNYLVIKTSVRESFDATEILSL
jgi:chaperonin GroEL (HSP60 family)